jgi:hypothetical protein
MKLINCHESAVFLIEFKFQGTDSTFIVQGAKAVLECLKTKDKNGIECIKEFDMVKQKFVRVSRKNFISQFGFDTELALYLEQHYYFR